MESRENARTRDPLRQAQPGGLMALPHRPARRGVRCRWSPADFAAGILRAGRQAGECRSGRASAGPECPAAAGRGHGRAVGPRAHVLGPGPADRWDLEQRTCLITGTFPDRTATAPARILGSSSPSSGGSWLRRYGSSGRPASTAAPEATPSRSSRSARSLRPPRTAARPPSGRCRPGRFFPKGRSATVVAAMAGPLDGPGHAGRRPRQSTGASARRWPRRRRHAIYAWFMRVVQ
jgi:hypothetical protein